MKAIAALLWVLACVSLGGCASLPEARSALLPLGAPGVTLRITPLPLLAAPAVVSQVLWIERDGETRFLQVQVELADERIAMAAFDRLGVRLFSIVHDGGSLVVERAVSMPVAVPVEIMLGDFLLGFLPEDVLRERLQGALARFPGAGLRRELVQNGKILVSIVYEEPGPWSGEVVYTRHDLGYRVRVRTIEVGPL